MKWVFIFLFVFLILAGLECLQRYRAKAMRALAARLNFQYSPGDSRIWRLRRSTLHYPTGFKMRCYPLYLMRRIWNVIDGERNGIRILIFDSIVGDGKGARYCTLIATQTDENLFKDHRWREKIAQRAGWTAVYRIPFIGIRPWTFSITRIEELLNNAAGPVDASTTASTNNLAPRRDQG